MAWIANQVRSQVAFWAHIVVFFVLGLMSAAMIPLAMILRRASPKPAH
jgi:hypothetical protein